MQNSKKSVNVWSIQMIAIMGVLVALEIILERIIAIPVGNITRFSIGKVVVIMTGMWFGPIPGAIVGMVSDILGGFLAGYGFSINVIITISSMMWGIIPALCKRWMTGTRTRKTVVFCLAILVNSVVSTLFLTTLGLVVLYGYNFWALLPSRLVQFAALVPTYCVISVLLYFSPVTNAVRSMAAINTAKSVA